MPLRPHQTEPVARLKEILSRFGSGVDFSGTGTGKTYVSSAVASASRLPTLVVHPKVARSAWESAADCFGDKFSQVGYEMLRTGNTPFGKWSGGSGKREKFFKCQCCQRIVDLNNFVPCYCHSAGIHCLETKSKPHDYGTFQFHPTVKQVIFDEVHRCNGIDSLNADMLIAAKRQGLRILGLTATAGFNPLQFRALGYMLDMHGLDKDVIEVGPNLLKRRIRPNFYRWASKLGCRRDPHFRGFKWMVGAAEQAEIMVELREQIIPARGVRVRSEDIPGFPKCNIQPELYDVTSPEVFDKLYEQVREAQEALKLRKEDDVAPDSPLTKILRARQEIELLKVPIMSELGQDYLDKGFSLVLFVNFRQTIEELQKLFPAARLIDGSPESLKQRQESIELFQQNTISMLLVNVAAGGECLSMQDLDGFHPRMGLVMPNPSATKMRQLFGRLPRDGGKSTAEYRVLLAAKTVETSIHRSLRAKLDNLDALNDADLNPGNLIIQL
jgi:superfamily II DNA or RNA helicase